jgi:molybdenum cofactor biosynthesis enzyme MoaA
MMSRAKGSARARWIGGMIVAARLGRIGFPKPTSELLHRLNRAVRNPRLKYAAILAADVFHLRHLIVRFDAVNACNLRCGMCFFSDRAWRDKHMKGQFTRLEIERLAAMFFGDALQVHIGCAMEPTMFRDYPWLVEVAKQHGVPFVGFTTNGQRLTEPALARMIGAGLDEITVSVHGVKRGTYETLMKGARFDRLHAALAMIDGARSAGETGAPRLRINYTICPDNLDELEGFFDAFGKYRIDTIQLRPIADFGDTAYTNKDLTARLPAYDQAVERIRTACRARGIALLANRADPTHAKPNPAAAVYQEGILRYLNPNIVWRDDFRWRSDDYRTYKTRIGWRRNLLRRVFARRDREPPASHQAMFEVL